MHKVTIFIPCYNKEKYLDELFESLLAQTNKSFSVLLSDDCSTDNSIAVVSKYSQLLDLKIVSPSKNLGLIGNNNFGIQYITTPYFLKVDADDLLAPNAIELTLQKAETENLDVCGCQLQTFGSRVTQEKNPIKPDEIKAVTSLFPCITQFLFKTSIFHTVRFRNYFGAEDYDLWVQILEHGFKVGVVDEVLLYYRIGEENQTVLHQDMILNTVLGVRTNAIKVNFAYTDERVRLLASVPSFGAKNYEEYKEYVKFLQDVMGIMDNPSDIALRCLAKWWLRVAIVSARYVGLKNLSFTFYCPKIFSKLSAKEKLGVIFLSFFKLDAQSLFYCKMKKFYHRIASA